MSPWADRSLIPLLVAAVLLAQVAALAQPTGPAEATTEVDPLPPTGIRGFLENGGQVDADIRYYAWTPEGGVALTRGGAIMTLVDGEADIGCNVLVDFVGASTVMPEGRDPLPGTTNILKGNDPEGWHTGLLTYTQVVYSDLWDGIDLVYRVDGGQLKYEMVIRPGADPADIRMGLSGHQGMAVDDGGDLVVTTVAGVLRDAGLVTFYADDPGTTVDCDFRPLDASTYGFRLGDFDPSRTLLIDPLVYSTFVGGGIGELEEPTAGVALDTSGRALVAGQVNTTDFPTTTGAFQTSNAGGGTDLFVFRLAADGSDVEWSTYVGGSGADFPYDIAVDGNGLPVVVGRTNSTDLPTTLDSFDPLHTGSDHEGFIMKLNAMGTGLVFSTYLGGYNTDEVAAVTLDGADDIYVAGNTLSPDLPTTTGAAFPNHTGLSFDAFLAKVGRSGDIIKALTYLGGAKWDVANAIDIDDGGWVYVGGDTISTDFPATNGSFQDLLSNNLTRDGFIAKVAPDLGALAWATYIGGMANDFVEFLHVDASGSVYAAGDTDSGDFPVTNGSFQETHEGSSETFILRMAANGSQLEYSTFVGGSDREYTEGFAVDASGNALVVGSTISGNFPTITGVEQERRAGQFDQFLFKLDPTGADALYSTYLGGSGWDLANGLALASGGDAIIVGATDSTNFPTTTGAYQETHGGRVDVTVTRHDMFLDTERPVSVPGTDMIVQQHDTVDFDGSNSTDNVGVVNWTWEFTYNGTDHVIFGPTFSWTFHLAGKVYVNLTVRDAVHLIDREWVSVFVNDTEAPVAIAPNSLAGQQHWTVTLDGGGSHDNVGVAVHTWTFRYGDEDMRLVGEKVEFTFRKAGVFLITLTVEDAAGNVDTDQLTITIIDITSPVLVLEEEDIQVDQHTTVRFDASASEDNVGITNISWQFPYAGAPIVLYGPAPAFTFDRVGSYQVTVTAEDANGNRAFGEVRVTVRDITPPVSVAGSDVTIDQGEVVGLDGSGSSDNVGIVTYNWTVVLGDEVIRFSSRQNAFTFLAAGVFTVTLNVTDAAGNTDSDGFTVRVRDITPPEAVVGESMVVGQGDRVIIDGTNSTDNVGIVTYNWELSMGTVKETFHGPVFDHNLTLVGTYRLILQVFDGSGLSDTDDLLFLVLDTEPPVPDAGYDQDIDLDGAARFDGTNSTDNIGIVSWVWTFNYNQAHKELDGSRSSFTFELQGTYVVTLTVTDDAGNTATDTLRVKVTSDDNGGGGGGGPGGTEGSLLWIAVAVVLVLVVALVLVARSRGGEGKEDVDEDMGWAPTEEEKSARDDKGPKGVEEGDAGDEPGV